MSGTGDESGHRTEAGRLPQLVIIGAMKCGTSTLHRQLAADPRFFMSEPKEPCFFSDDEPWARGLDWYRGLFAGATPEQICGESSTHYTKLPTHPRTVERMVEVGLEAKFVYVVRDPADRLVSQFIHEWSEGRCGRSITRAVQNLPEMLDYGAYGRQLRPYVDAFGPGSVLTLPFEVMKTEPGLLVNSLSRFLGVPDLAWTDLEADNVSRERIRQSAFTRAYAGSTLRRMAKQLIPTTAYARAKRLFQMRRRPQLPEGLRRRAEDALLDDADLLEDALGVAVAGRPWADVCHDWAGRARLGATGGAAPEVSGRASQSSSEPVRG